MSVLFTHSLDIDAKELADMREQLASLGLHVVTIQEVAATRSHGLISIEQAGPEHPVFINSQGLEAGLKQLFAKNLLEPASLLIHIAKDSVQNPLAAAFALQHGYISLIVQTNGTSPLSFWIKNLLSELCILILSRPHRPAGQLIIKRVDQKKDSNLNAPGISGPYLRLDIKEYDFQQTAACHDWVNTLLQQLNQRLNEHPDNCQCCTPAMAASLNIQSMILSEGNDNHDQN